MRPPGDGRSSGRGRQTARLDRQQSVWNCTSGSAYRITTKSTPASGSSEVERAWSRKLAQEACSSWGTTLRDSEDSGPPLERDDRASLVRFEDLGQRPCPRVEGRALLSVVGVAVVDVRRLRSAFGPPSVRLRSAFGPPSAWFSTRRIYSLGSASSQPRGTSRRNAEARSSRPCPAGGGSGPSTPCDVVSAPAPTDRACAR